MADIHHHHDTTSTVVTDTDGPSAVLIAVIVLMLVGFLIWLFAFSGVVMDRNGGTTTIERDTSNTTVTVPDQNTDTTGGTGVQPSP